MSNTAEFLNNRIERLEQCIHELEVTANHFYDIFNGEKNGWNTLLKARDNIKKLIEKRSKRFGVSE